MTGRKAPKFKKWLFAWAFLTTLSFFASADDTVSVGVGIKAGIPTNMKEWVGAGPVVSVEFFDALYAEAGGLVGITFGSSTGFLDFSFRFAYWFESENKKTFAPTLGIEYLVGNYSIGYLDVFELTQTLQRLGIVFGVSFYLTIENNRSLQSVLVGIDLIESETTLVSKNAVGHQLPWLPVSLYFQGINFW